MSKLMIEVGEEVFSFPTFEKWVSKAQGLYRAYGVSSDSTICVDSKGRICTCGAQMMRARDDDSFPVRVFIKII